MDRGRQGDLDQHTPQVTSTNDGARVVGVQVRDHVEHQKHGTSSSPWPTSNIAPRYPWHSRSARIGSMLRTTWHRTWGTYKEVRERGELPSGQRHRKKYHWGGGGCATVKTSVYNNVCEKRPTTVGMQAAIVLRNAGTEVQEVYPAETPSIHIVDRR